MTFIKPIRALKITHLAALPPLAWVATVNKHGETHLLHGTSVYACSEGFAEGAWAGKFDIAGLRIAEYVVGSGGWLEKGALKLRGASHILERLWLLTRKHESVASNSLPLLLAKARASLDFTNPHYEADLLSFLLGPTRMKRFLPLINGEKFQQFTDCTIEISAAMEITVTHNSRIQGFENFSAYREHLAETCLKVCDNARALSRPKQYVPLATISRGYDSPACAVLARECGARNGITFSNARDGYASADDDGTAIGVKLGLGVVRLNRLDYLTGDGYDEALFLASGGGGEDVVLAAANHILPGSVLFTGFLGDTVWGFSGKPTRSSAGRIAFPGGGAIGEYRIHRDFIHLPIPILDLRSHRDTLRISKSDEMNSWRLQNLYDRPIPRRIAETAGIPREWFGLNKMAITAPLYYDQDLGNALGVSAKKAFDEFCGREFPNLNSVSNKIEAALRKEWLHARQLVAWRLAETEHFVGLQDLIEPTLADRGRRPITPALMLTPWAIAHVAMRYSKVISNVG